MSCVYLLIRYADQEGNCRDVTSTDVNGCLRDKDITAKHFRA